MAELEIGSNVICKAGSIDKNDGQGAKGIVTGFSRLSHYHKREVSVKCTKTGAWLGWFWEWDLETYIPAEE